MKNKQLNIEPPPFCSLFIKLIYNYNASKQDISKLPMLYRSSRVALKKRFHLVLLTYTILYL